MIDIEELMSRCSVNIYYNNPNEQALGFGKAYLISKNYVITSSCNLYDNQNNIEYENIEIELKIDDKRKNMDISRQNIYISSAFKNCDKQYKLLYDLAFIKLDTQIQLQHNYSQIWQSIFNYHSNKLQNQNDSHYSQDDIQQRQDKIRKDYQLRLQLKDIELEEIKQQVRRLKEQIEVLKSNEEQLKKHIMFNEQQNKISNNLKFQQVQQSQNIEQQQIFQAPIQQSAQNQKQDSFESFKQVEFNDMAVGTSFEVKEIGVGNLYTVKEIGVGEYQLNSIKPESIVQLITNGIEINNSRFKRLKQWNGFAQKLVINKEIGNGNIVKFKILDYGKSNKSITFGFASQRQIYGQLSGQVKQVIQFITDPEDETGIILSFGKVEEDSQELFVKKNQIINVYFNIMAKKCNILMKRQNSNLFKYESTIKDIKWYPFIILMGQNQEIQIIVQQN